MMDNGVPWKLRKPQNCERIDKQEIFDIFINLLLLNEGRENMDVHH